VSPATALLPSNAVIVDDLDTTHFARYGAVAGWHSVSGSGDHYYLGHMYWTSNTYSVLDNYAIWTPPALNPGPYQVYAFIDWDNATTQQARYRIVHNGQTTVFTVNQNLYYAEWVSLGTYDFGSATGSNYARLEDVTGETYLSKRVGFDAIAFVPHRVYLPLVLKSEPIRIKAKAGIHLGNRSADWNTNMLNAIDGSKPGGIWPAMITVLSDQVYNLGRPQTGTGDNPYCHIVNVDPWRDQNGNPRKVYDYLKRAAQAGVKVVIRVNPSPGNFQDWNDPGRNNHHLTSTDVPEGGGYCGYNGHQNKVRDVKDIAIEMQQIHAFNAREGWQEYAFEPANEPNTEWYSDTAGSVQRQHATAWREMDVYFSALYDQAKVLDPSIRILTPPMAQSAYAEPLEINSPITATVCDPRTVYDGPNPAGSGYDNMMATYTTKNDGFSWHNYWNQGREAWGNCPPTHHVYKVFPQWMKDQIRNSGKPSFITESDLSSPGQGMGNPMSNKNDPTTTADSIRQFIAAEVWGQNVVIWLINNNFADKPEYDWHEAFNDNDTPRSWFTQWWPGSEQWP
jgi:hypothetical protein